MSPDPLAGLNEQLSVLFEQEPTIRTLATVRIDGDPFFVRTRSQGGPVTFDLRVASACRMVNLVASQMMRLSGDGNLRTVLVRSPDKLVALSFSEFFVVFVETSPDGNAKGIATKVNALWQKVR